MLRWYQERWGAARNTGEASLAGPPITACCLAWFLTGHGLVPVCGPRGWGPCFRPRAEMLLIEGLLCAGQGWVCCMGWGTTDQTFVGMMSWGCTAAKPRAEGFPHQVSPHLVPRRRTLNSSQERNLSFRNVKQISPVLRGQNGKAWTTRVPSKPTPNRGLRTLPH